MAIADIATLAIKFDSKEVKSAEKDLNSFEKQGGKAEKQAVALAKAGKLVDKNFSVLSNTLKTGVVAGLAGVTAAFGASIVKGGDYNQMMAEVKGISRATAEEFAAMDEVAKMLGESTEFSATQAAEGLKFLSMAGFTAKQSVEALPGVLDLATAGNIGLGEAADIASNALTAMRLPVSELGRVNDVFVKTITTANTDMRMMAESFKYSASVAAGYGVSVETLSGLIGMLGNAGIQGSMAGTQLAAAFGDVASVFEKYGVSARNADGSTKNIVDAIELLQERGADAAEIMDIFGERAGRGMLALTGMSRGALREYIEKLNQAEGATKTLSSIMRDTFQGDVKSLQSALESLAIDAFTTYEKDLRTALQSATKWIRENKDVIVEYVAILKDNLIDGLKSLWEIMKLIYENKEFVAGFIAITVVLPKVVTLVAGTVQAFNTMQIAMVGLTASSAALAPILGTAALAVGGFIAAYKLGEWAVMREEINGIKEAQEQLNATNEAAAPKLKEISDRTGIVVNTLDEFTEAANKGLLVYNEQLGLWLKAADAITEADIALYGNVKSIETSIAANDNLNQALQRAKDSRIEYNGVSKASVQSLDELANAIQLASDMQDTETSATDQNSAAKRRNAEETKALEKQVRSYIDAINESNVLLGSAIIADELNNRESLFGEKSALELAFGGKGGGGANITQNIYNQRSMSEEETVNQLTQLELQASRA